MSVPRKPGFGVYRTCPSTMVAVPFAGVSMPSSTPPGTSLATTGISTGVSTKVRASSSTATGEIATNTVAVSQSGAGLSPLSQTS